ncbi:hypothetical protein [Rubrobacter tropicus]|nr:hypothetical protein [Rubrobacter tropicus]
MRTCAPRDCAPPDYYTDGLMARAEPVGRAEVEGGGREGARVRGAGR